MAQEINSARVLDLRRATIRRNFGRVSVRHICADFAIIWCARGRAQAKILRFKNRRMRGISVQMYHRISLNEGAILSSPAYD